MDRNLYLEWKDSPPTRFFLDYLKARSDYLKAKWAEGEEWTEESRMFVQNVTDIMDLEYEDIEQFYEENDDEDEEG